MILVNGKTTETVHALDRGLQYGDGLFETIRVRGGSVQLWARHLRRLTWGCERLHMPSPDTALLTREAESLVAGVAEGVLKIVLTRGVGGRGYRAPKGTPVTRILSIHPFPEYPAAHAQLGVAVRTCQTRLGLNPALAGVKHLNRLEQILARDEWDEPDIAEGLMLDAQGRVVEGTMTNLFIVKGGVLLTPDLSQCGVRGIMRDVVMEIAVEHAIPTRIVELEPNEVNDAEELFLCNSIIGIWPVRILDGRRYQVGPLSAQFSKDLEQHVH